MRSEVDKLLGMLRDAKRAVREHLSTRPATKAEALAIQKDHEDRARRYRERAEVHFRDHGPISHKAYNDAMRISRLEEMRAAAWHCPGEDMKEAWDLTLSVLQGRVKRHAEGLLRAVVAGRPENGSGFSVRVLRDDKWDEVAFSYDRDEAVAMFLENTERKIYSDKICLCHGDQMIFQN